MSSIFRGAAASFAIVASFVCFSAVVSAEEAKTAATTAVYSKTSSAPTARAVSWPSYYYYGVYYGSYRWRYQPYYTFYASPWYDTGYHYGPYSYAGPAYGYSYTWPHYGAYGYTYYGPVVTGW